MPKPKTGRPRGRPPGERQTDAHAYVRMTSEERKEIEEAIERQLRAAGLAGARLTVSGFMLAAALEKARSLAGK